MWTFHMLARSVLTSLQWRKINIQWALHVWGIGIHGFEYQWRLSQQLESFRRLLDKFGRHFGLPALPLCHRFHYLWNLIFMDIMERIPCGYKGHTVFYVHFYNYVEWIDVQIYFIFHSRWTVLKLEGRIILPTQQTHSQAVLRGRSLCSWTTHLS